MEKVKPFVEWITKKFFPISIGVLVLIYIWWFRLKPWEYESDYCCLNGEYKLGLTLLFFYCGSAIFWWLAKNHTFLRRFLYLIVILFLALNSWYVIVFAPRLIDFAKYNGIEYYLVSYPVSLDTPWRTAEQLTKWYGVFDYETLYMDDWAWKGKILYDKNTGLVNVVDGTGFRSQLLYTDDNPPRYYEHDSRKLGNHLYYVSSQCLHCSTYPYTMYKCGLDNTSCVMLPFRYTGEGEFGYLEVNEITKEVEFYVSPASGGNVLAYSYGDHPRCYVEGCEILEMLK